MVWGCFLVTFVLATWSSSSSGAYKNLTATCSAFSRDGSILAISYDKVATLWDPSSDSPTLLRVLAYPSDTISQMVFGSRFLYTCTVDQVFSWDLLKCELVNHISVEPDSRIVKLSVDPESDNLLIAGSKSVKLYPSSLSKEEGVLFSSPESEQVIDACHGKGTIFFMDKSFEITSLNIRGDKDSSATVSIGFRNPNVSQTSSVASYPSKPKSLFSDTYAVDKPQLKTREQIVPSFRPESSAVSILDDVPTNMLPNPSLLITSFFDALLEKRSTEKLALSNEVADEETLFEDDSMSTDEVPVVLLPKRAKKEFLETLFTS